MNKIKTNYALHWKADLSILSVNSTYKGLNSQTYYGAAIWNSLSV